MSLTGSHKALCRHYADCGKAVSFPKVCTVEFLSAMLIPNLHLDTFLFALQCLYQVSVVVGYFIGRSSLIVFRKFLLFKSLQLPIAQWILNNYTKNIVCCLWLPCMNYDIEFLSLLLLKTMQKQSLISASTPINVIQLFYWNLLSFFKSWLKIKVRQGEWRLGAPWWSFLHMNIADFISLNWLFLFPQDGSKDHQNTQLTLLGLSCSSEACCTALNIAPNATLSWHLKF